MNISIGFILCLLSFIGCAIASSRSIGFGVGALMAVGYFYGVLRANFYDGFSHFIFDAGVVGFYVGAFGSEESMLEHNASRTAAKWAFRLAAWPMILFLLPINHYLIQLVGLRHLVFFLPFMALAARFKSRDLDTLVVALAVLNSVAFGFALWEYAIGIKPFFPLNASTEIMYHSIDVKTTEGRFHRLPSVFTSAHAYAGTMFNSFPFLLNTILNEKRAKVFRLAVGVACVLTVLGIFLAGPRLPVIQMALAVLLMIVLPGLKFSTKTALMAVVVVLGVVSATYVIADPRMQRFTTLSDTDMVEKRTAGSLQLSLYESIVSHPFGVGLGGVFGSSIPSFLKQFTPVDMVGAENEFARITVEQGVIGFIIWVAFLLTLAFRKPVRPPLRWSIGIHAMRAVVIASWGTAFVGVGILQSIPGSILLLVMMGYLLRDDPLGERKSANEDPRNRAMADARLPSGPGIEPMPVSQR